MDASFPRKRESRQKRDREARQRQNGAEQAHALSYLRWFRQDLRLTDNAALAALAQIKRKQSL
jgi:hypothetical protein